MGLSCPPRLYTGPGFILGLGFMFARKSSFASRRYRRACTGERRAAEGGEAEPLSTASVRRGPPQGGQETGRQPSRGVAGKVFRRWGGAPKFEISG